MLAFVALFPLSSAASERPNIVVILSDDMGFSDIGCYGGEINTPNLNRLAAGGLRFTQFYNTARCCPTRASLLTGLYQHQAGIGHMMGDDGLPGYRGNLNDRCATIAEVLRPAGYGTYISGKWHVTRHVGSEEPKHNWPRQRGFDRFYGTIHGAGSFFDPNSLTRDNRRISPYADSEYQPEQFYYTDAISDHAVRFISEHDERRPDDPLFLYVAYTAAHWPMHALEKDIAKYQGKYDAGYGAIRKARLERMRKLGLVDSAWAMAPQSGDWEKVEHRAWELRCMEVYAAMVDSMDQGIGRIVGALEHSGRLDNTLILYLQDNGGCAETLGRQARGKWTQRPQQPLAAMPDTEIQTQMIPAKSRSGYPVIQGPGVMPGPADTYIAYGKAWANVSNTPFRMYKHWVHEGGIATPLIAHWPRGVKQTGNLTAAPGHLVDIMATCVEIAAAEYPPPKSNGNLTPLAGKSLLPVFQTGTRPQPDLFWEHEGNRAIRSGDWKLVSKYPGDWELYNLRQDRTELDNLAAKHPQRVADLSARYAAWAERSQVVPWGELIDRRRARRKNSR